MIIVVAFIAAILNFNQTSLAVSADLIEEKVYIGGFPVAMVLKVDGLIVEKDGDSLHKGDIIRSIDGKKVTYASDITQILKDYKNDRIVVEFLRKSKNATTEINVLNSGKESSLGISVREDVSGIGMVTYVKQSGEFVALGHKITDSSCGDFPFISGKIFECEIIGLRKSSKGTPGEIRGVIKGNSIGEIYKNTPYGVSGRLYRLPETEKVALLGRNCVLPGRAEIYSTLKDEIHPYKGEIIKPMGQIVKSDKGMVIRVTDKELLSAAGGILQGMSGSPIVQNGKIVGAVTHVFINDPQKGYGIYAEWMNCLI